MSEMLTDNFFLCEKYENLKDKGNIKEKTR